MSAVAVAALLDVLVGEPPPRAHPVVWMGAYLGRVGARLPAAPAPWATAAGGLALTLGIAGSAAAAGLVARSALRLPAPARALAEGAVLWTLGSGRLLADEVAAVEDALGHGLDAGRERLARIVSRDPSRLDAADVRASALESLAENLSDSVVAPLFWYAVAGLPAAAAYRFVNTADAMWGYRTLRWEYAGKAAARADDALNLVPARLTAFALLAVARAPRPAWARLGAEAGRTPSPNSGWPMAALALALDLRLPKLGHYVLNRPGRPPAPADTAAALRLFTRAAAVAVTLAAAASHRRTGGPRPRVRRGRRSPTAGQAAGRR
ncbi:MAG: cobalamin biosynthesis protein CobD [Frankia sp.]|nr:cobalamin biosynthesis protein CobD [Frankia sp.]